MVNRLRALCVALLVCFFGFPACGAGPAAADVDAKAIALFDQEQADWLSNGRTYSDQRFSPLTRINAQNVRTVGSAWEADLQSPRFGIEATPLEADGILYTTSSYSRVFAFDARTGHLLWTFDPQVPRDWLPNGCCKPMNRGVALWRGKVFVASYDGRLIALNAKSGRKLWEADTTDRKALYTITGAPIVVDGLVVIGNGGGDFGTRGFFSAYDADTGKMAWRFFVVPGSPKKGFEQPELAMAAKTWDPKYDWAQGGDANPWNSFSFDPNLDLIYLGTGNGPWLWGHSGSGIGKGKELFASSILAVHAKTGKLAWFYQTTPGDMWDFDACQDPVLADIKIGGVTRKVLMQANKNGFFYVLDRETGQFLSAEKFVYANWAAGVNAKTGEVIALPQNADYRTAIKLVFPSPIGGHNWMGMAFDPRLGLAFIPARDKGWTFGGKKPTFFYDGYDVSKLTKRDIPHIAPGILIAWNPVTQTARWRVPQKTFSNGGVLATAGNLVVQGTEDGYIRFYRSDNGALLHQIFVGTGIVAPPMTYAVDGIQYIAIGVGWTGERAELPANNAPPPYENTARLIVLKLGGGQVRAASRQNLLPYIAIDTPQSPKLVRKGESQYAAHCATCHTMFGQGSIYPDLRRMSRGAYDSFQEIVLGGALKEGGMAGFRGILTPADVDAIRAYVVDWAQQSRRGNPYALLGIEGGGVSRKR